MDCFNCGLTCDIEHEYSLEIDGVVAQFCPFCGEEVDSPAPLEFNEDD